MALEEAWAAVLRRAVERLRSPRRRQRLALLVRLLVDDCSSSVVGAKYARASLGADLRAAVADMADVPE